MAKENIGVNLFEEDGDGNRAWESQANFLQTDVHKQYGITFRTPPYHNRQIKSRVRCFIELILTTDKSETSDPIPFYYVPKHLPIICSSCKSSPSHTTKRSSSITLRPTPPYPSANSPSRAEDSPNFLSEDDLPTVLMPPTFTIPDDDMPDAIPEHDLPKMLIPSEYTVPENVVNKIVYETDPEQERCATKRVQSGIHGEAMAIGRDFRGTSENIGSSEISKIRNPVKNLRLNLPDGMRTTGVKTPKAPVGVVNIVNQMPPLMQKSPTGKPRANVVNGTESLFISGTSHDIGKQQSNAKEGPVDSTGDKQERTKAADNGAGSSDIDLDTLDVAETHTGERLRIQAIRKPRLELNPVATVKEKEKQGNEKPTERKGTRLGFYSETNSDQYTHDQE